MFKKTIVMILFLALPAFSETVTWSSLQKNIDSWTQGPPSLILTDAEKDVYRKLKAPEEKMQFIKIFWLRRDPILRTTENEFKLEFYRRVDFANQNYAEGNLPGWQTARGQVYIQFGPPSRIDTQSVPDSSRPALLWVYDKPPSKAIPPNEVLMFIYHEFRYVLAPPNPNPGDSIGEAQRQIDANFRYQLIPSQVQQAFADVRNSNVIDESKNYDPLLYSVKSSEKFQISALPFEVRIGETHLAEVTILKADLPFYDEGDQSFAELLIRQELKEGDRTVASNEQTITYNWTAKELSDLPELKMTLKNLDAPSGSYELSVTVQDRISLVSETKKVHVTY